MNANELLLQGFITMGIFLTYSMTMLLGVLVGIRLTEKEQEENGKQIQSEKEKSFNGTKFTFLE